MSDLRIGIIAEGPTDIIIIEKIVKLVFKDYRVVCVEISPTPDELSGIIDKPEGFGWGSVYKICHNLKDKLEILEAGNGSFDMIVIQVDGDVMFVTYESARIHDAKIPTELPCYIEGATIEENCSLLESVICNWKDCDVDSNIILCIPYINTELWAAYCLYPSYKSQLIETLSKDDINSFLLSMPRKESRLLRDKNGRIRKLTKGYRDAANQMDERLIDEMKSKFTQFRKFHRMLTDFKGQS